MLSRSLVLCLSISVSFTLVSLETNAQTAPRKPKAQPIAEPTPAPTPPPPPPPLVSSHNHQESTGTGRLGFSYGFFEGGSAFGSGFVGARYFTSDDMSVGGYLLLSNDSSAKTSAVGLGAKLQSYFAKRNQVQLFYFGQLSLGKNGGEANKGKDDMLLGLGGGVGVEYTLLDGLSFSYEAGLGLNTLPDGKNAFSTGTSRLALNIYY